MKQKNVLGSGDYALLKKLCAIHAPCGNESELTSFLLNHIKTNSKNWKHKPKIFAGKNWQDNIILVFGKPRTAIFAHLDSIGFTVRYGNQLVKIGKPRCYSGIQLTGKDSAGSVNAELIVKEDKRTGALQLSYKTTRELERGTELVFKPEWREDNEYIQCCYMDNRLGILNALKVAETLKDGVIAFSTYEEHGGGSVSYIQRFLQDKYKIRQALISDISWISDGIHPGQGPVISMRDSLIPRKSFLNKIIDLSKKHELPFQLEIEDSGGSDAKELQMAEYPWDWCFIGAAEQNVHTPDEKVHKKDAEGMVELYKLLMQKL